MRINFLIAVALGIAASGVAHANATLVTGTYSIGYTPIANNGPTISDTLSSPFNESLAISVPSPLQNFIAITPASSCTRVVVDVVSKTYQTCTATGTVTATFAFTNPTGGIMGTAVDTGVYTANYYSGNNAPADTDSIVWNSPDPIVVSFNDGAVLDITLANASDWTLYPQISFDLVKDPNAIPEPATLALLGAGMVGVGALRKRRAAI